MSASTGEERWQAVRRSLEEITERFADLASSARSPGATAVGRWSVGEVVAHVAGVAWLNAALLGADVPALPVPGLLDRLRAANVDGINELNDLVLAALPERDPKVLAGMLRDQVAAMTAASADGAADDTVTWVGGSSLPVPGLFAHLQNELLLHGHDLGAAVGRDWRPDAAEAAPFFEMFIFGLARHGTARLLDGGGRPRPRRIAVEFRPDGVAPATLVLQDGRVSLEPPGSAPDVRLTFDPLAMSMMMFGRASRLGTVASGRLKVGGRRPWLLPVFLRTFRVPS
ncbi:maleylpyruvate isomerase N-terminal domain-containing protein [Spirillospora sp. NPDC049024]